MSLSSLVDLPAEPESEACKKSYWILGAAHQTASELLDLFDNPGGQKREPGNPSNTDQDLLRSMLIFAGAGLDAAIKQLIKKAFPGIVENDEAVRTKVVEHFSKHLARSETASTKDLVRWLFEEKPRTAMINAIALGVGFAVVLHKCEKQKTEMQSRRMQQVGFPRLQTYLLGMWQKVLSFPRASSRSLQTHAWKMSSMRRR